MKKKKIDTLSDWDWTTLVAAWRYYENRQSIAAVTFPADIVERFWGKGNPYSDAVRDTIAIQFAKTDHGLRGEEDWTRWLKDDKFLSHRSACEVWTTFYQFCRGWVDGYAEITASNGKTTETVKAFYTECTKLWTPVDGYILHPHNSPYIPEKYIKKIQG